jgi:hypothetical protein
MMEQSDHSRSSELPELENALLWCMRAWVIGHCNHRKVADRIETVLGALGAAAAVADLDGFMRALSQGARRRIEVNCVCYQDVSDDERLLLDAFALQQQEDHEDAYAILAHFMAERAVVVACEHAQRLALVLAAAGRVLTTPRPRGARNVNANPGVAGSAYLH